MAKQNFAKSITAISKPLPPLPKQERIKANLLVMDELKSFIRPLEKEERETLKANIAAFGIKDPLAVWEVAKASLVKTDGLSQDTLAQIEGNEDEVLYVLIDGHNRLAIANELKIDFPVVTINFAESSTLDDIYNYIADYQIGRRNLTPQELSYFRGRKYNTLKKGQGGNNEQAVDTSKLLAEEYKVSVATIKRDGQFSKGVDKLDPEAKQAVLSGNVDGAKELVTSIAKSNETNVSLDFLNQLKSLDSKPPERPSNTNSTEFRLLEETIVKAKPKGELIKTLRQLVNERNLEEPATIKAIIDIAQLILEKQA